ncbi:MAG: DNA repair protein RadC [Merdibacter sp.]
MPASSSAGASIERSLEKVAICSPDDLVRWLRLSYGYAQQEHFIAVYLNQQNEILHHRVLFIGTLNASMVHPREVFKEAMRQSASSIICAHNHPGGSAEPSSADHHVTRQIVESGKIVGIPLMDHIIVSPNAWFSFRQSGFID